LAFLPAAPSPTVPVARFVCLGGITTVSHPVFFTSEFFLFFSSFLCFFEDFLS
jgi:hypothetical protein